mgnify:CR=1 FL=1
MTIRFPEAFSSHVDIAKRFTQSNTSKGSYVFFALILLVLLQPDLGMTILIASTFFCQLFIAGLPMMLVMYGLALILSLSVLSYFFLAHVKNRIDSFLGNADTYQIDLSLRAFKSGGIFGKGPGQGDLKEKIPDANTDFIFAVAGEELGLIFCLIILILSLIHI